MKLSHHVYPRAAVAVWRTPRWKDVSEIFNFGFVIFLLASFFFKKKLLLIPKK